MSDVLSHPLCREPFVAFILCRLCSHVVASQKWPDCRPRVSVDLAAAAENTVRLCRIARRDWLLRAFWQREGSCITMTLRRLTNMNKTLIIQTGLRLYYKPQ